MRRGFTRGKRAPHHRRRGDPSRQAGRSRPARRAGRVLRRLTPSGDGIDHHHRARLLRFQPEDSADVALHRRHVARVVTVGVFDLVEPRRRDRRKHQGRVGAGQQARDRGPSSLRGAAWALQQNNERKSAAFIGTALSGAEVVSCVQPINGELHRQAIHRRTGLPVIAAVCAEPAWR